MDKNNEKIKSLCRKKHVPYWKLAIKMNTSESSIYRKLRQVLTDEEETKMISIIEEIANEQ